MSRTETTVEAPPQEEAVTRIPSLIKRNTIFFAAAQVFVGVGNQLIPTLSALMVVHLLGSAALAGIGASISGLARFLIAYPIGSVNDRYGRRAGLMLGLALSFVGAIAIGLSLTMSSFSLFVVGLLIFGLGVGAGYQLRLAAADMYPPTRRAEGVGFVLTGSMIGALGGPVLIAAAARLAPVVNLDEMPVAWFLIPAILIPSAVLVLLVRPDPKEIAANLDRYYPGHAPEVSPATSTNAESSTGSELKRLLRHYPKQVALVTSFAVNGNMYMMMALMPLVLDDHGHELTAISLTVAIHVIGMFGLSMPLGRLADKAGRRNVMILGMFFAAAGSALIPASSEYWPVTIGGFLVGLGWSCSNVAVSALIADTTAPAERGRAIGIVNAISAASGFALPLLAGPVVASYGFTPLGVIGVGLMVVPLYMTLRLRELAPGKYREATIAA